MYVVESNGPNCRRFMTVTTLVAQVTDTQPTCHAAHLLPNPLINNQLSPHPILLISLFSFLPTSHEANHLQKKLVVPGLEISCHSPATLQSLALGRTVFNAACILLSDARRRISSNLLYEKILTARKESPENRQGNHFQTIPQLPRALQ